MAEELQIGDIVDVSGSRATVRYVGTAEFSPGTWIGVELDSPDGKNNGTVQGVKYFDCADKYGKFFKPHIPRLIERPVQVAHRIQNRQSLNRIGSVGNLSGKPAGTPTPMKAGSL